MAIATSASHEPCLTLSRNQCISCLMVPCRGILRRKMILAEGAQLWKWEFGLRPDSNPQIAVLQIGLGHQLAGRAAPHRAAALDDVVGGRRRG